MKAATRLFSLLGFIVVMLCPLGAAIAASGDVDSSFGAVLAKVGTGQVYRSVIQPDGKVIITGEFAVVGSGFRRNIARINPDGSLDATFNPPLIVADTGETGPPIRAVALQSDGKVIISGSFARGLKRLNPDGSLDTAFNSSATLDGISSGYDLKILSDGRVVFSGVRPFPLAYRMIVLGADGGLISEAPGRGDVIEVQGDGKIVLFNSVSISLYRLNADLTLDSTFTPVSTAGPTEIARQIFSIQIQADGKIVFGGSFVTINGGSLAYLARANPNGTVDAAFNNAMTGPNSAVYAVVNRPGGKVLIGGGFSTYNGVSRPRVALINSDGSLDTSFSATVGVQARDLDVQLDDNIILSGVGSSVPQSGVARLNSGGSMDPAFDSPVGFAGVGYKVKVLPDNKILVGGDFTHANGVATRNLARFNADGTIDPTLIQSTVLARMTDFDVYPDGKVLVVPLDVATRRLNVDGSVDAGFPAGSPAFTARIQPDGKALVTNFDGSIRRLNANGTVDGTFSATTTIFGSSPGRPESLAVQSDGKVLVGGYFESVNGVARIGIARLNPNGSLDTTFNTPGGVGFVCCSNNGVEDIQVQIDGKILIAGDFNSVSFTNRQGLARLNSDGTLDTNFVPLLNYWAETVKLQPDGKVFVGGEFNFVGAFSRQHYARLNADGSLDSGFIVGTGADGDVNSIDLRSDGKILMVGAFSTINGLGAPGIVRLLNASTNVGTLFDYDGDGRSDVSVFRPSDNTWYVLRSSDLGFTQQAFAISGDVPTPADFDGDGKTDFAVFRPSNGDWWYLSSMTNTQINVHWGQAGDIPRPSDFDGDGKADYVVYRPSNSVWYRYGSTGEVSVLAFGLAEDIPVIGDFDGDAKSDVAIFRPSVGDWWYAASSAGGQFRVLHWGATGDVPAPADYDGDGKTDFAVYRPSEGVWYILSSGNASFLTTAFGLAADKPVPADYDGDGRSDIAVFRPSTGIWYLQQTTAGFGAYNWGISTDVPTPNAFVP